MTVTEWFLPVAHKDLLKFLSNWLGCWIDLHYSSVYRGYYPESLRVKVLELPSVIQDSAQDPPPHTSKPETPPNPTSQNTYNQVSHPYPYYSQTQIKGCYHPSASTSHASSRTYWDVNLFYSAFCLLGLENWGQKRDFSLVRSLCQVLVARRKKIFSNLLVCFVCVYFSLLYSGCSFAMKRAPCHPQNRRIARKWDIQLDAIRTYRYGWGWVKDYSCFVPFSRKCHIILYLNLCSSAS